MTNSHPHLLDLADGQLLTEVKRLAACERQATVALIAALAEVDRRRLYLDEGYASLFTYAIDVLRLSESAAYRRIEAARVVRRFPIVLERLSSGDVTLTTITMLAAHLTAENIGDLLNRATHRKKREVELLVATLHPQADARSTLRKLPVAQTAACGGPEACLDEFTPRRRDAVGADPVQVAGDNRRRDPATAPPGAGPAASRDSGRRPRGRAPSRVDAAGRGRGTTAVCGDPKIPRRSENDSARVETAAGQHVIRRRATGGTS